MRSSAATGSTATRSVVALLLLRPLVARGRGGGVDARRRRRRCRRGRWGRGRIGGGGVDTRHLLQQIGALVGGRLAELVGILPPGGDVAQQRGRVPARRRLRLFQVGGDGVEALFEGRSLCSVAVVDSMAEVAQLGGQRSVGRGRAG